MGYVIAIIAAPALVIGVLFFGVPAATAATDVSVGMNLH